MSTNKISQVFILFHQQLKRERIPMLVWGILLLLMTWGTAVSAPAATQTNVAEKLMKSFGMESFTGGGISAFPHPADWFMNMKLLSWLPFFMGIYAILASLSIVSKDEDAKNAEFLLSLPIERSSVITGRLLGVAVIALGLAALVIVSLVAALPSVGMVGSYMKYITITLSGYAISLGLGSVALFISLVISPYSKALRYSLGLIILAFLYDIVLKMADPDLAKGPLGMLTPFGWFNSTEVFTEDKFPWMGLAGGLILAVCFSALSIFRYAKREVV